MGRDAASWPQMVFAVQADSMPLADCFTQYFCLVVCAGCDAWYHFTCVGMIAEEVRDMNLCVSHSILGCTSMLRPSLLLCLGASKQPSYGYYDWHIKDPYHAVRWTASTCRHEVHLFCIHSSCAGKNAIPVLSHRSASLLLFPEKPMR